MADLSKDVTRKRLVDWRRLFNKLEEVETGPVLLHHHLEELGALKLIE